MASTEDDLAIQVELHESPNDKVPTEDKPPDVEIQRLPTDLAQEEHVNDGHVPEESADIDDIKFKANTQPGPETESMRNLRSIRQRNALRVVVSDIFDDKGDAQKSNSKLTQKESSLSSAVVAQVTTILIDETDEDTTEYDTTIIALPKSPICALLLMESVGIFQDLEGTVQTSIIASIVVTILAQIGAGVTLFVTQLLSEVTENYSVNNAFMNIVVISFIVIYLSQDCAQIYKMWILLKWMRSAEKVSPRSTWLIALYLLTNVTLYVFLLYYSVVELLIHGDIGTKLEAAVAVYFILELDDWLYNVTIEPLKILEDTVFDLVIHGHVGSNRRRLKHVTYWFWGVFAAVLVLQALLFVFQVQSALTIPKD